MLSADKVVLCPYDKNHKISTSRIQKHLIKCEKNFPPGFLSICPYNATHRMPKDELSEHILNCPQKLLLHPMQYADPPHKKIVNAKIIDYESLNEDYDEDNENWEKLNDNVLINTRLSAAKHEELLLDERIPKWVEDTMKFKNLSDNLSILNTSEIEASDSASQINGRIR